MKSILLFVCILCVVSCSSKFNEDIIILKNSSIIPIYRDTILLNKNIVIKNKRIVAIEDIVELKYVNSNTIIVDCSNKFVIPGLFDSHFHYGRNETLYNVSDSLLLKYGVTNVFSFHGSDELLLHKKKIDNKELIGPKIISTGRNQREDDLTSKKALQRLEDHKEKGFEFIKVYTNLSEAAFELYDKEAKAYGIRLVGHIPREIGFFKLMNTNQELIVHAEEILYNEPINYLMGIDDNITEPDYLLIDTIVSTLKKHNKWVSPTLVAFKSILDQAKEVDFSMQLDSDLNALADYWNWQPPKNQIPSKFNTDGKRFRLEKGYLFQELLVKEMDRQNVKILAGTDAPAYWNLIPGKSLHHELQLLNSCGVSEYETLKTATIHPSQFLNVDNDYGTIEVNKIANLIILDRNPLINISNIETIHLVILNGKPVKKN